MSQSSISHRETLEKRMPTDLDDINLQFMPDWVLSLNRRSNATRRSTNKSLKKVSAERHEMLIRLEEGRRRKEEE